MKGNTKAMLMKYKQLLRRYRGYKETLWGYEGDTKEMPGNAEEIPRKHKGTLSRCEEMKEILRKYKEILRIQGE